MKPFLSDRPVSLFIPSLAGGGAERVILNLARGFCELGIKTHVVLARAEGCYLPKLTKDAEIFDLKATRVSRSIIPLARYIRRHQPLAIFSALSHANIAAIVARTISGRKSKLILTEHTDWRLLKQHSVRESSITLIAKTIYPSADAIVAVSQGVADSMHAVGKLDAGLIRVIYNPVALDEIINQATEPLDHPWFEFGQPPVIVSAGRLAEEKDFFTLLRVFAGVRQKRECRLLILGEGPLRHSLEQTARDLGVSGCVCMPGFVENPFKYMAKSALFVLSSRFEGFSMAIVEAMACGLPIVSTNCPGPSKILENGRWGRLVEVGSPRALEEAILQTLSELHSLNVKQRAAEFGFQKSVVAYLDLISRNAI